jgi:hypothetical protein
MSKSLDLNGQYRDKRGVWVIQSVDTAFGLSGYYETFHIIQLYGQNPGYTEKVDSKTFRAMFQPESNSKQDSDLTDALNYALGGLPKGHNARSIKNFYDSFGLDPGHLSPKSLAEFEKGPPCAHTFALYHGFNDSFEYCTKCDEKKK